MKNPIFKIITIIFFGTLLLIGIFLFRFFSVLWEMTENPLFPPEMNAAQYPKNEFVIGDLGGVPVRIPHYFAEYVEYDGDPGFGEKRKVPAPERTYQSKLASFGFNVRFPDMAGISSIELWKDYYDPVKSLSPWIDVGFNAGNGYPGDGFLDRYIESTLNFRSRSNNYKNLPYDVYEKLEKPEFGLTVYAPPGINPKNNQPYRIHEYAYDLFVHRNTSNKVDVYIRCNNQNIPNWKYTSCTQRFSMEPDMKAAIYVSYTRNMLPHWREIQKK